MRIVFIMFFVLGTIWCVFFFRFFTPENIIKVTESAKSMALQVYPTGLVLDISAQSGVMTNSTWPIIFSKASLQNIFTWSMFSWDMIKNMGGNNKKWMQRKKSVDVNGSSYDPDEMDKYENILVIDTNASGDISSYNTFVLLTKTQLIINANKNEKRVYEIKDAMEGQPDIHITPESAEASIQWAASKIIENADIIARTGYTFVAIFGLIILIFGSFFVGLFTAIILYLYALIVWIVSKAMSTNYTYKQIYSMSVLWFTLPFVLRFTHTRMKFLLLLLIVWRVMYIHKTKKEEKPMTETIS